MVLMVLYEYTLWAIKKCATLLLSISLSIIDQFLRAKAVVLLSACLSHRNFVRRSVCPSITWVDQSKIVQATITKSSLSAAWKTLVSGTIKFFHKFEGGDSEQGR